MNTMKRKNSFDSCDVLLKKPRLCRELWLEVVDFDSA